MDAWNRMGMGTEFHPPEKEEILGPPLYTECQEVPRTDRTLSGDMSRLLQLQESSRNPKTVVATAEVESRRGGYLDFLQIILWRLPSAEMSGVC